VELNAQLLATRNVTNLVRLRLLCGKNMRKIATTMFDIAKPFYPTEAFYCHVRDTKVFAYQESRYVEG